MGCLCWCNFKSLLIIFALLASLYLVGFPVAFRYSAKFESKVLFSRIESAPECPFAASFCGDLHGIKNLDYKFSSETARKEMTIGYWHIQSGKMLKQNVAHKICEGDDIIIMYLHDFKGNRGTRERIEMYKKLQDIGENIQIFAIDYRGYGDSTSESISEVGFVEDAEKVYRELKKSANCRGTKFFIWGRGLGAALAGELYSKLQNSTELIPSGIILETPFPNMAVMVRYWWFYKFYEHWASYCDWAFKVPLEKGPFLFNLNIRIGKFTDKQLESVMIIRIHDDAQVPYFEQTRVPFRKQTREKIRNIFEAEKNTHNNDDNIAIDNKELWRNIT